MDIVLLRVGEEASEVQLGWELGNALSIVSYPLPSVLEDEGILAPLDVGHVCHLVVSTDVTQDVVEERRAFDPKIDRVKEVVEIDPR